MVPQEIFNAVLKHFEGDSDKTWKWFTAPHPSLGYKSPIEMIKARKAKQVVKFALSQMELYI